MKKSVTLIPSALLVLIMPMLAGVQADTSSQSAATIRQNHKQSLEGHWVDTSGRGVLTFDNGIAFLSPTGEADPQNTYQVELSADDQLTMIPAEGSKKTNKTITTEVDWQKQSFSFKNGLYNFVRPPQISAQELNGYWHEEADMQAQSISEPWNIKIMPHATITIGGGLPRHWAPFRKELIGTYR